MNDLRKWMRLCESHLVETEIPDKTFARAAKQMIGNFDWSGGEGETVIAMVTGSFDEKINTKSREFRRKLNEWAEGRAWDAYQTVNAHFNGDLIRVYRVITAAPDWKPDPARHPGEYWAYSEQCAEAHWGEFGDGHVEWLLTADVHRSQINWVNTLAVNGSPDSEDECEITTLPETPINFTYKRVK